MAFIGLSYRHGVHVGIVDGGPAALFAAAREEAAIEQQSSLLPDEREFTAAVAGSRRMSTATRIALDAAHLFKQSPSRSHAHGPDKASRFPSDGTNEATVLSIQGKGSADELPQSFVLQSMTIGCRAFRAWEQKSVKAVMTRRRQAKTAALVCVKEPVRRRGRGGRTKGSPRWRGHASSVVAMAATI